MARKKIEPIKSLGSNVDNLTVQKSRPLFALWRSELSLSEFKILDTYLSRSYSHKPDRRTVTFEKGELEQLLGIKKINTKDLENRLMHLMGNVVKIPDSSIKKGFKAVTLFEEAVAEQDDNGLWQVKLECTQKAMKYFFNIENLGYLRYKLRCITSLTSRYTYVMFCYLEANRFRKTWTVELDELKKILACNNEESYQEYKRFNDLILKKVQKEMLEKTECEYTYEPVKSGRRVIAIRFTLKTLSRNIIGTDTDFNVEAENEKFYNDKIDFLLGAVTPKDSTEPEFSREQMQTILEILITIPETKFPKNVPTGSEEFQQYHFLAYLYALMNTHDNKQKPIKNRFAYFIKMLKSEAGLVTDEI